MTAPAASPVGSADLGAFDQLLAPEAAPSSAPATGLELAPPPHDHLAPGWSEFSAGWQLGIYQDPVLCGILAGAVLGMLGVFVVLRRAVFVTAAISQSAGLGVVLAFALQIHLAIALPPVLGALLASLVATSLLALRSESLRRARESMVGFCYIGASAAAILVGDRIAQEAHDVAAILFGTAVLVRPIDLLLVAIVAAAAFAMVAVSYRGLVFVGFDPEGARVHGLPVRAIELSLWLLVAVTVSVTTRAIGALPVFAFAVLPALAALAVVERLGRALIAAALLGAAAGGLGYLAAFFLEFPVGAAQAALAVVWLVIALALGSLRTTLRARLRRPVAA
jgi:ABC-type Mn2+/Zn2+ transport system permease subunit